MKLQTYRIYKNEDSILKSILIWNKIIHKLTYWLIDTHELKLESISPEIYILKGKLYIQNFKRNNKIDEKYLKITIKIKNLLLLYKKEFCLLLIDTICKYQPIKFSQFPFSSIEKTKFNRSLLLSNQTPKACLCKNWKH